MRTEADAPVGGAATFPRYHAERRPDSPAIIMGRSGNVTTYLELEERANQVAGALVRVGLRLGETVAIVMDNCPELLHIAWGAQRIGLRYTVINHHLLAGEIQYILDDSEAKALISAVAMADVARRLDLTRIRTRWMVGGTAPRFESYEERVAGEAVTPVDGEVEGTEMLYSSGTTGQPKGVRKPLPATPLGDLSARPVQMAAASKARFGIGEGAVYLVPAPLYHAAPLVSAMTAARNGATTVVMERFDPALCLQLIQRHRVTHAQFVPTMFIRMLALPTVERDGYDLTSLQVAIHAAAPCPIEAKQAMIDWWGPILTEYYAGTEDIGGTTITSEEWLRHRGSVGRANPGIVLHIVGADGGEQPAGTPGQIYLEGGGTFEYHNDPGKTASITDRHGWRTLGDIGYLDQDRYLYLTDRQSNMIVVGGVNVYPQEAENVLVFHPRVADAAVIGVPNAEYGEEVKAVVQLRTATAPDDNPAGAELAGELIDYCRARLAKHKCPRSVDFVEELPRDPNGKLFKRRLRERYWQGHTSGII